MDLFHKKYICIRHKDYYRLLLQLTTLLGKSATYQLKYHLGWVLFGICLTIESGSKYNDTLYGHILD